MYKQTLWIIVIVGLMMMTGCGGRGRPQPTADMLPMLPLRVLEGHTGPVWSVVYSPDGATLASGAHNGTVILWDVETGQQLRVLEGHTEPVLSVAYSPDGATLASGSDDETVILWDVETGRQLRVLQHGHTWQVHQYSMRVNSVAYSPDGATLASGVYGGVILWDVETEEQLHTLEGYTCRVRSVAYSPDGATLASGADDETVILWDVETGQQLRTLEGHAGGVKSVAYSLDGATLASGSGSRSWSSDVGVFVVGTVILWDVETGRQLRVLEGHTSWVGSVAYSPDGATLALGSSDGTVILWDVSP